MDEAPHRQVVRRRCERSRGRSRRRAVGGAPRFRGRDADRRRRRVALRVPLVAAAPARSPGLCRAADGEAVPGCSDVARGRAPGGGCDALRGSARLVASVARVRVPADRAGRAAVPRIGDRGTSSARFRSARSIGGAPRGGSLPSHAACPVRGASWGAFPAAGRSRALVPGPRRGCPRARPARDGAADGAGRSAGHRWGGRPVGPRRGPPRRGTVRPWPPAQGASTLVPLPARDRARPARAGDRRAPRPGRRDQPHGRGWLRARPVGPRSRALRRRVVRTRAVAESSPRSCLLRSRCSRP